MEILYNTGSVTVTLIDPADPDKKKYRHTINNLIENPDAAKLTALGDAVLTLYPNMAIAGISINRSSDVFKDGAEPVDPSTVVSGSQPAEGATAPADTTAPADGTAPAGSQA